MRERERKVFLIPTVWAVCRTGASSQRHQVKLLVWVGVESRFTGIICKLISNESLKEKSFHRLRVIINTRNKNYNSISFCAEFRNLYIFCVCVCWMLTIFLVISRYLSLIGFRSIEYVAYHHHILYYVISSFLILYPFLMNFLLLLDPSADNQPV